MALAQLTSLEICAGAGGQALGLEKAGFEHTCLVELDAHACQTLRYNRPSWRVVEGDLREFSGVKYRGVDLLAGGVPCPPFSVAGKQLGATDERDLFPEALRLVAECAPRAVMLENVKGILDSCFDSYRTKLIAELKTLGYKAQWRLLNASDYGVSQLRPRVIFVALQDSDAEFFSWPTPSKLPPKTVGQLLVDLMAADGWGGAMRWAGLANDIAPTLVGGSKKHGGPDLGPTRARKAWASLGVDGLGIADTPPPSDFTGMPRLTVKMAARIQGFPDDWTICGRKTNAYRQVGNAFPPPVAQAVGLQLRKAFAAADKVKRALG